MNIFKAQSSATIRKGYWMDFKTNRNSKKAARRKARHSLNSKTLKDIV